MKSALVISLLILLAACQTAPEVDLGAPADAAVNELSPRQLALAWRRSVKAAQEVVGPEEYCRFRAVFARHERHLDLDLCDALEADCLREGRALSDMIDSRIADAFGEACGARVGDLEACLNDALKVVHKAASKIGCADDPMSIDRKLPVPKTCDAIRDGCIIPVLVYLLRNQEGEEE